MKLAIGTPNIQPPGGHPVVAIGNFDGLHLGHQAILRQAVAHARTRAALAVALTFEPHPTQVLAPEREMRLLYPFQTKIRLIEALGVDMTFVADFNAAFARQSPEVFAQSILRDRIGCRTVVVGRDYRFGKDRAGDVATLTALGRTLGFEVISTDPVGMDGIPVRSSRIRALLHEGDVALAARLLGRHYAVSGKVIRGDGRGKSLGFPTANIRLPNEVIPGPGIYAARIHVLRAEGPRAFDGAVYLGANPTFHQGEAHRSEIRLEAHLLDFDGDLYDRRLQVTFVDRVRGDEAFANPDALIQQMRRDVERARALLKAVPPPQSEGPFLGPWPAG